MVHYPMDYWRIYDQGIACTVESYREDHDLASGRAKSRYLVVVRCLIKLHSVLTHARLAGQELPNVSQVIFHMDWRGLKGRGLILQDERDEFTPAKLVTDRFPKTITLPWGDVRDDYFKALHKISVPFFGLFAASGQFEPATWLTKERVGQLFERYGRDMRLFDP